MPLKVSWVRSEKGAPLDPCKKLLRINGCQVDAPDDPFWIDILPKNTPLTIENCRNLNFALRMMQPDRQLVFVTLAHVAVPILWFHIAKEVARKGATAYDIASQTLFDFAADPGAAAHGAELVQTYFNKCRGELALAARVASGNFGGRPKILTPAKRAQARRLWGDGTAGSVEDIAKKVGCSSGTLRREMILDGREIGRIEAVALVRQGKWK